MENTNEYGVYVVFSSKEGTECQEIKEWLHLNSERDDDILLVRKCYDKNTEDTKRFHCCIRKDLYINLSSLEESENKIYPYRANQKHIGKGKTYGFYIKTETPDKQFFVQNLFKGLEGKYIRQGSYKITPAMPREDGSSRGYTVVSFQKNGDYYPRPFIRTLRALINDVEYMGDRIEVKWCVHSVMRDVESSLSK